MEVPHADEDAGFDGDIKHSSPVFLATLKSKELPSSTVTKITTIVEELLDDVTSNVQNTITMTSSIEKILTMQLVRALNGVNSFKPFQDLHSE